jgi:hypothetical protein
MNIWVYDLSSLTYSFDAKKGYTNIYSKNGELLSSRASKKNEKKEEQIFQALDTALKEGRKIGSTVIYKYGFYNPYSNQIAIEGVPETTTYQAPEDLSISNEGEAGEIKNGIFEFKDFELIPAELGIKEVVRAIKAHQRA